MCALVIPTIRERKNLHKTVEVSVFALPIFTGSDGSAAGGGKSDLSEWQRSAGDDAAPTARTSAGHRNRTRQLSSAYMCLTSVFGMAASLCAACGGSSKGAARAAVGEGRRRSVAEDIRRAPQPETGGQDTCSRILKRNTSTFLWRFVFALPIFIMPDIEKEPSLSLVLYVRVTYFHGQSPGNYRRRTCA